MHAHRRCWVLSLVLAFSLVGMPLGLRAEERTLAKVPKPGEFNPSHDTVELFAGMKAGQLEVKFIPRDEKQAKIIVANKAGKPLNVQLPETFAGVPVLAQFRGFPLPNTQPNNNQTPQTVGGPINKQNNAQNGNNFFNNNMMNIPAEQVRDIKVACVCLEHGKPDPRPTIPYEMVPLESVSKNPALGAMLREFGTGKYSQHVAQAAAWHLNNEMSWERLAKIDGSMIAIGVHDPYFTKQDLQDARGLVASAEKRLTATASSSSFSLPSASIGASTK